MKIVDMHCDTISCLLKKQRQGEEVSLLRNNGHVDLMKLKKGNYLLQNFALFVFLNKDKDPLEDALQMSDLYYQELEKHKDIIAPVFTFEDIEKNKKTGKISAMLTVEEGGTCKGELSYLRTLYRLGVRMLTLTWNFPNELGHPNLSMADYDCNKVYEMKDFTTPNTVDGLTETGILFLEEMERLGMIVDVSHLSDAGFYDVYKHTTKPFVASHSNARAICPFARNLTDDMIRKLAERGSVTGLNFCPDFLTPIEKIGENNEGDIASIVAHAKHIVNVGGIDCLGLGTDYDGISGHKELPDAGYMPLLIEAFKKAGFTESQIDKITKENVLRVYRECLK